MGEFAQCGRGYNIPKNWLPPSGMIPFGITMDASARQMLVHAE
jgi:hypothetical protein